MESGQRRSNLPELPEQTGRSRHVVLNYSPAPSRQLVLKRARHCVLTLGKARTWVTTLWLAGWGVYCSADNGYGRNGKTVTLSRRRAGTSNTKLPCRSTPKSRGHTTKSAFKNPLRKVVTQTMLSRHFAVRHSIGLGTNAHSRCRALPSKIPDRRRPPSPLHPGLAATLAELYRG